MMSPPPGRGAGGLAAAGAGASRAVGESRALEAGLREDSSCWKEQKGRTESVKLSGHSVHLCVLARIRGQRPLDPSPPASGRTEGRCVHSRVCSPRHPSGPPVPRGRHAARLPPMPCSRREGEECAFTLSVWGLLPMRTSWQRAQCVGTLRPCPRASLSLGLCLVCGDREHSVLLVRRQGCRSGEPLPRSVAFGAGPQPVRTGL